MTDHKLETLIKDCVIDADFADFENKLASITNFSTFMNKCRGKDTYSMYSHYWAIPDTWYLEKYSTVHEYLNKLDIPNSSYRTVAIELMHILSIGNVQKKHIAQFKKDLKKAQLKAKLLDEDIKITGIKRDEITVTPQGDFTSSYNPDEYEIEPQLLNPMEHAVHAHRGGITKKGKTKWERK